MGNLRRCCAGVLDFGVFFIMINSAHGVWINETVDDEPELTTCMLTKSDGTPVIVYAEDYPNNILVATYNGTEWVIEQVADDNWNLPVSAVVDSQDGIHITYASDYEDSALKHLYWDGYQWVEEIVDEDQSIGEANPCIAVDSLDNIAISYQSTSPSFLMYAYYDGSGWQTERIPDPWYGIHGYRSSLTFDENNDPHISYFTRYGKYRYEYDLKYACKIDGEWFIEVVTSDHDPMYTSITLDGDQNPWIGFLEFNTQPEIWVANKTESEWEVEIAFEDATFAMSSAFETDKSGIPNFVYSEGYATWNGLGWDSEVIDPDYDTYRASLTFDAGNHPHVSYIALIDVYNRELRYARRYDNNPPGPFNLLEPLNGSIVAEPVTLDWEDSTDDDGHTVTYDVWYATDPSFDPHDEVNELTDSTYTFPEGTLSDNTTYYWKVRAWDGYDETWSGPDPYWSFTVDNELSIPVSLFSAESTRDGVELTWECAETGVGFNLYRSEEATGVRTKLREIINAGLITGESPYNYLDAAVENGLTYNYWLEAIDAGGASETFGPVSCTAGTFVPTSYALYQSRPNPARATSVIAFDLPENAEVTLSVYDLSGRKIKTPVDETLPAGAYEKPVSGLAPGVYVYRLLAGEFSASKKMVVQ